MLLFLITLSGFAGITEFIEPKDAARVKSTREIVSRVDFKKNEKIKFYATFQTPVSTDQAEQVITRYDNYEKFIPFVTLSRYDARTGSLDLEGGVLGWNLKSTLQVSKIVNGKLSFEIISGHFKGLKGFMMTERTQDYKTLVLIQGELDDKNARWPPVWVVENGGKIVFQISGNKLRSLIEEEVKPREKADEENNDVPKPRRAKTR
ncbi:MAG: hypothetical protein KA715_07965 [Xanthomonadaceae bacterium]|nr:hypothetical protein [Xanthomonadaceae bacterium]